MEVYFEIQVVRRAADFYHAQLHYLTSKNVRADLAAHNQ